MKEKKMSDNVEIQEKMLQQTKQVLIERCIQKWKQSGEFDRLFEEAGKKRIIELIRQRGSVSSK